MVTVEVLYMGMLWIVLSLFDAYPETCMGFQLCPIASLHAFNFLDAKPPEHTVGRSNISAKISDVHRVIIARVLCISLICDFRTYQSGKPIFL